MRDHLVFVVGLGLMIGSCGGPSVQRSSLAQTSAGASAPTALAAAKSIVGVYSGSSTIYGFDAHDSLQPVFQFSEVIEAKDPTVQNGRAFVSVTDTMTFPGGGHTTIPWTEGFHVNPDGTAGARYFAYQIPNVPAEETLENALNPTSATFDTDVSDRDIQQLGFSGRNVTYKKHTTVKQVVTNGNVETDVITRFTMISWKDAAGAQRSRQFVSMTGFQTRTLN